MIPAFEGSNPSSPAIESEALRDRGKPSRGHMTTAAVIIPTTGSPEVRTAIESVLLQSHPSVRACVVVDGPQFETGFRAVIRDLPPGDMQVTVLEENVGRDGFYGPLPGPGQLVRSGSCRGVDSDDRNDRRGLELFLPQGVQPFRRFPVQR